jgi:hypothetical protein
LRAGSDAQAQGAVTTQGDAQQAPGAVPAQGSGATPALLPQQGITPADLRLIGELQQIDARVRAHEAAHEAAGGGLAGGASFSFAVGPDGRAYAVGGEVPIEFRAGRTPQETITLAQQVLRAALAPADPSAQDLSVASAAQAVIADAEALLAQLQAQQRAAGAAARPAQQAWTSSAQQGAQATAASPQPDARDNPLAALALAAYRKAFPAAGAITASVVA